MEDLLLNSFIFFFLAGMIGYTINGPETPNRPDMDWHDSEYDTLTAAWEKTKEGKAWHKFNNTFNKMCVYWFYIMLAHGVIFCIWLFTL